jgi:hypothetical protein
LRCRGPVCDGQPRLAAPMTRLANLQIRLPASRKILFP